MVLVPDYKPIISAVKVSLGWWLTQNSIWQRQCNDDGKDNNDANDDVNYADYKAIRSQHAGWPKMDLMELASWRFQQQPTLPHQLYIPLSDVQVLEPLSSWSPYLSSWHYPENRSRQNCECLWSLLSPVALNCGQQSHMPGPGALLRSSLWSLLRPPTFRPPILAIYTSTAGSTSTPGPAELPTCVPYIGNKSSSGGNVNALEGWSSTWCCNRGPGRVV